MNTRILNPLDTPDWDEWVAATEGATFFHSSAWARVLSDAYGYRPFYFSSLENGRLRGVIPVMEIDSFFTGRHGVSLPFTDFCHPLADTPAVLDALMEQVTGHGKRAGWDHIEFKGGGALFGNAPCSAEHFTHDLALDPGEAGLQKAFRESTRRNIRHAQKAGVVVDLSHTCEALRAFYRLHCLTRRYHGLPPQPWSFFSKIHAHIIGPEKGVVALGVYNGQPIAGAVYFLFKGQAIYKFGASDRRCQHLRANNLVMWEAIRWFCQNGYRSLHLGRTEPENSGLLQFKSGWRAAEGKIAYYKLDLKTDAFMAGGPGLVKSYPICRRLPIPVLRLAGRLLYRHVG